MNFCVCMFGEGRGEAENNERHDTTLAHNTSLAYARGVAAANEAASEYNITETNHTPSASDHLGKRVQTCYCSSFQSDDIAS